MLSMVGNENQTDWDLLLPHVSSAYNNSVNAATGLAPNEVHIGRLPRLPLSVFEPDNVGGHQSLERDHLTYINLATERQQRAYSLVRELYHITTSRLQRRNAPIMAALSASPPFTVGGWAWVYNSASTIRQGAKKDTDATVLKTKLALNWNGPFKILAVGPAPASDTPDNRPLHDKLLFLDLPSDLPGRDSKPRVSVKRCKPCRSPDDTTDLPKYLPADLTTYVLTASAAKSPPYHVTADDVTPPPERLDVERITGHQLVRGRGGVIAVLYETHWPDFSAPPGNGNSTSNISGDTSLSTGQGPRHSTDKPTACTDKCASVPHTGNSHGRKAKYFSLPATPWSPATSGSATSAQLLSPLGHTFGTRRATASGGLAKLPTARPWTPLRTAPRTLPRTVPTSSVSWTTPGPSRSTSSTPATLLPGTPSLDRGVYNAMGLEA